MRIAWPLIIFAIFFTTFAIPKEDVLRRLIRTPKVCYNKPNTQECCKDTFSKPELDLYFAEGSGEELKLAKKKDFVLPLDQPRPVQAIQAECWKRDKDKPNNWHKGAGPPGFVYFCYFSCEDTRPDHIISPDQRKHRFSLMYDSPARQALLKTKNIRRMRGFILYCESHQKARVIEEDNLWLEMAEVNPKRLVGICEDIPEEERRNVRPRIDPFSPTNILESSRVRAQGPQNGIASSSHAICIDLSREPGAEEEFAQSDEASGETGSSSLNIESRSFRETEVFVTLSEVLSTFHSSFDQQNSAGPS